MFYSGGLRCLQIWHEITSLNVEEKYSSRRKAGVKIAPTYFNPDIVSIPMPHNHVTYLAYPVINNIVSILSH